MNQRAEGTPPMHDNFWSIQREITELLAKTQLTHKDLLQIEQLRDRMLTSAA